ncbi:MAG: hypothetical protein AAGJ46_11040 [Planctomycetota bacterium]
MPQVMPLPARRSANAPVGPLVGPESTSSLGAAVFGEPLSPQQDLTLFGRWVGEPIWAPPLESSKTLAESMLRHSRPFTPSEQRWSDVVRRHRDDFTQVREIELVEASIRLPKGRFFISVTEQKHFDRIEEEVPACVQTRLDEFLQGPGSRPGVKVTYLKPLCVEVGDELILTSREDLHAAINKIKDEVFAEYHRRAPLRRSLDAMSGLADLALAVPRRVIRHLALRRQRAIEAYHSRIEFERRKTALDAARLHKKLKTDGGTYEEMLALTKPIDQTDVIRQFCIEEEISAAEQRRLLRMAAGSVPWFVTLSAAASYAAALCLTATPPVVMCDPAFVAEMPTRPGELLKIGHFDEVGGVMHIEI